MPRYPGEQRASRTAPVQSHRREREPEREPMYNVVALCFMAGYIASFIFVLLYLELR